LRALIRGVADACAYRDVSAIDAAGTWRPEPGHGQIHHVGDASHLLTTKFLHDLSRKDRRTARDMSGVAIFAKTFRVGCIQTADINAMEATALRRLFQ